MSNEITIINKYAAAAFKVAKNTRFKTYLFQILIKYAKLPIQSLQN